MGSLSPPTISTTPAPTTFAAQARTPPPPRPSSPPQPESAFELACKRGLPPPGPEHWHARRLLWLSPPPSSPPSHLGFTRSTRRAGSTQSSPESSDPNLKRLELLLNQPSALTDDAVWNAGLGRVWKGLVGGGKLKRKLPLRNVIKILHAGWMHDGTWPKNTQAIADTDDFLGDAPPFTPFHAPPPVPSASTSSIETRPQAHYVPESLMSPLQLPSTGSEMEEHSGNRAEGSSAR